MHFELTPATQALLCEVRKIMHKQAGAALDDDTFMDQLLRLAAAGADRKPGTPSYQIAIGVCARCERVTQDGGGKVFDIDPKLLEVALCDASVVTLQRPDAPVSRKIPPARRAAVLRRAHGCDRAATGRVTTRAGLAESAAASGGAAMSGPPCRGPPPRSPSPEAPSDLGRAGLTSRPEARSREAAW